MNRVWYSICSAHMQEYHEECDCCNAGNWVDIDDPEVIAGHELWKKDPAAWRASHGHRPLTFTDREGTPVVPFPNLTTVVDDVHPIEPLGDEDAKVGLENKSPSEGSQPC